MITIKSHGFKFSRPEANFVFDVSYFVNPWRDKEIRMETDPEKRKTMIIEFMDKQEGFKPFVDKVVSLLVYLYIFFPNENLQIAFCCSAGEYRSPAIALVVSEQMKKRGVEVTLLQSINSKI